MTAMLDKTHQLVDASCTCTLDEAGRVPLNPYCSVHGWRFASGVCTPAVAGSCTCLGNVVDPNCPQHGIYRKRVQPVSLPVCHGTCPFTGSDQYCPPASDPRVKNCPKC